MISVANPIYDAVFKYLMEDERVAKTLLSAASDAKLRQDMNVEDEYFTAIENRDTAIMLRDKKIAERDAQLAEKDGQLAEKDMMLSKTIKMLLSAGLSVETIAVNMNIDSCEVERLSKV